MSASADKGNRNREIEQSPMKKKFKDPTISREDLDDAIANGIKLALKEQQSTMDLVVASAVRDAVDTVLIPVLRDLRAEIQATNNSVKELRAELEALASAVKQTCDRIDSVQAAAREDRRTVTDLRNQLERLTEGMTDMEDRSRRNNVRLVWLLEGVEGSDAQDNVTLLFFPDFSPATTTRRKSFNPVLKKMTSLGLQPFLTYRD